MTWSETIRNLSDSVTQNEVVIQIVSAIIILLIGFVIARFAGKAIEKALREIQFDINFKKMTGWNLSPITLLSKSVTYFIYLIAIVLGLETVGITFFFLNAILVVVLLLIGISILIGIKDFIPNLVAGYNLRRKGLINEGDQIKLEGISGKIVKINTLEVHIINKKKELIVVPNTYLTKSLFIKK